MTIQSFLAARLIQRITITPAPALIGSGMPLFGSLPADVRLDLLETKACRTGLVQSTCEVV